MDLKTGCGNACGSFWCCTVDMSLAESEDCAYLLAARGMRVYKSTGKGRVQNKYIAIGRRTCMHLKSDVGCGIHKDKPEFCKQFPNPEVMQIFLPRSCPFSVIADEIIDDMKDITEKILNK